MDSKTCTKCGTEHPRTSEYFYLQKARKDGLRSWCIPCWREYNARWRDANPEKKRDCSTRYREENSDKERQRKARYRAENPEKVREGRARWRTKNPEKRRLENHSRRASKRNAEGSFTAADIEAQRKRQKGKCYYASPDCKGELTIEHLVPLARGGSNWPHNIVLACKFHNCSKNDKLPHEYAKGGRLL